MLPKKRQYASASWSALVAGVWLPAINAFFCWRTLQMSNDGWHSFVALNDESASVMPVSILRRYGTVCLPGPASVGGAVFAWYCRRDAFAHQPGNDKLNGALDGAAGLCWYEDSNYKPRYLLVNLMAQPNRHNCWETVYAKYWCARKQSARRCLPVSQTQQGEAQIWRREVSSDTASIRKRRRRNQIN